MGILSVLFIGLTASAQTTTPYQPISDPYANQGVQSATTRAAPDVYDDSGDGKVTTPEPMICQPTDDEE